MDIILLKVLAGLVAAVITAFFAIRKLIRWLKPIRIEPSFKLYMADAGLDEIGATIINISNETQYIRKCYARGTYSFRYILLKHLRNPLLKPSLYPNVWYGNVVYSLMDENPIKLELHESRKLVCQLHEHPFNAMYTPYFFIEAELTSGKKARTKKIETPPRWKLIGYKKTNIPLPN